MNQRSKDLEVMRQARKVLVRHWIDLGRISLRSTGGTIRVRGTLARLPGYNDELIAPVVDAMFNEISRIRGVNRIMADLDGWDCDGGIWKQTGKGDDSTASKKGPAASSSDGAGGTTNIQEGT